MTPTLSQARQRSPEGTSRKARAKAWIFMLAALSAGLSAAWMIKRTLEGHAAAGKLAATRRVAVAALDLPLATTLNPEMVTFVDWPVNAVPPGAHEAASELEGRVTSREVAKGEPLLDSRLAKAGAGQGMAAVLPGTQRAMTVRVNEVIGVGGFVHPNDLVDVIATMETPLDGRGSSATQEFRSKIVLQRIRVLAVGEEMATQNAKPVKVPVVTLMVTPEQSERLALASTQGKVQLTLRSQADQEEVATVGVSPTQLFGGELRSPGPEEPALAARPKHRVRRPVATVPVGRKETEVVEVLRGDRVEERKVHNPEGH